MASLLGGIVNGVWRPERADWSTDTFRRVRYVGPGHKRAHDVDVVLVLVVRYRYFDWTVTVSMYRLAIARAKPV